MVTVEDVIFSFEAPAGDTPPSRRDRAILELFYSTGMRLSELRGINRMDLDLLSQQVKVRGKGRKERIVPIGDHAQLALRNYESKRDELLRVIGPKGDRTAFFLSNRGKRMSVRTIQNAVKGFLDKIDESSGLSTHSLRHTFATFALRAGVTISPWRRRHGSILASAERKARSAGRSEGRRG